MTRQFGQQSTTDDVLEGIDLNGQRVLITGVSAGLGVETARVLVEHGAQVVGTARDLDKARRATGGIARLELQEMDLASLASVRACADRLNAAAEPFDVVIANAGVMACPKGITTDGFETQFGTNHLGHFLFVNRVAPLIKAGGRVVVVSSLAHRFADVDLQDPNYEHQPYVEFQSYGRSKTANILFAVEFDRRHRARGVRATALHPGAIETELARHLTPEVVAQLPGADDPEANLKSRSPRKTIPQGAATTVWCGFVAAIDEIGGRYCEDCHVAETIDAPLVNHGVASYALDPQRARQLWALSESLVGETF